MFLLVIHVMRRSICGCCLIHADFEPLVKTHDNTVSKGKSSQQSQELLVT